MAIPDYQTIMKPLLEFLKKHPGPQRMQDVIEALSSYFSLSETEKEILLPSGQQNVINNRIGWARTYLKKAGLLDDPKGVMSKSMKRDYLFYRRILRV